MFRKREKKAVGPEIESETRVILSVVSGAASWLAERWVEAALWYADAFDRQAADNDGVVVQSFNGQFTATFSSIKSAYRGANALGDLQGPYPHKLYCGIHSGEVFRARGRHYSPSFGTAQRIAAVAERSRNVRIALSGSAAALLRPHLTADRVLREVAAGLKGAPDLRIFAVAAAEEIAAGRKSAFISYRREGGGTMARLIAAGLAKRGVEAFVDVDNLQAAHFDRQLLDRISAAGNFVLVLTPNALDRCVQADDWVALEIGHALAAGRNVVPVMTDGFAFPEAHALPEAIRDLPRHNAIRYSHDYGEQSIDKLHDFLVTDSEAGVATGPA